MKITQIGTVIPQKNEIKLNQRELYIRLGVKYGESISFADKIINEVINAASCRAGYIRCNAKVSKHECDLGFGIIKSDLLCKNLFGCREVYIFAATIGSEIDRLILKKEAVSSSELFITDAVASAYMESFADYVNKFLGSGKNTRPRFSPGFGNFGIEFQEKILNLLNAGRLLGIRLSEGGMMIPVKSVTAVIGIADEE